jgi:hypothetical protein
MVLQSIVSRTSIQHFDVNVTLMLVIATCIAHGHLDLEVGGWCRSAVLKFISTDLLKQSTNECGVCTVLLVRSLTTGNHQ